MGREVRMVPEDWEHPTKSSGNYVPLYGGSFSEELEEWLAGEKKWKQGLRKDYRTGGWKPLDEDQKDDTYEDWDDKCPSKEKYMPDWPPRGMHSPNDVRGYQRGYANQSSL